MDDVILHIFWMKYGNLGLNEAISYNGFEPLIEKLLNGRELMLSYRYSQE